MSSPASTASTTVLFLTSRPPFPPENGRKKVLFHYCRYISEVLGNRLIVASFSDDATLVNDMTIPSFIDRYLELKRPRMWTLFPALLYTLIVKKGPPMQSQIYFSKTNAKLISKIIEDEHVDVVFFDMVRTARYSKHIQSSIIKVVDLDDLLSIRYRRQLEVEPSSSPIGPGGNGFLRPIKGLLSAIGLTRAITEVESKLLREFEISICRYADHVVLVSDLEARLLQAEVAIPVWTIPIGVNSDELIPPANTKVDPKTVVFVGSLDLPHNATGIEHFVASIWPLILRQEPEAKLLIVGRNPQQSLIKRVTGSPSIIVEGEVDDIRPWVQTAAVSVAPILFGSGVKTKVIESLAMGVPVVTNTLGTEGISGYSGCPVITADTDEQFAREVISLLAHPELRHQLSLKGLDFISRFFDWKVTLRNLESITSIRQSRRG